MELLRPRSLPRRQLWAQVGSTATEGHHLRFDRNGRLTGITIVNSRWLLDNEGQVTITLPERVLIDRDALNEALSAA